MELNGLNQRSPARSPHSTRRNPAPIGAMKSYSDPKVNKESVKRENPLHPCYPCFIFERVRKSL